MNIGPYVYRRCTRMVPCPVCGRQKYCMISEDGKFAVCTKTEDGAVRHYSYGHLHALSGDRPVPNLRYAEPSHPPCRRDIVLAFGRCSDLDTDLDPLAEHLHLDRSILRAGRIRRRDAQTWAFPMYSDERVLIGLKFRNLEGRKWCQRGSRLGLFLPISDIGKPVDYILVLEGETDTLQAYAMGYNVCGRPSATSCRAMLARFLVPYAKVIIVADNDKDGTGFKGARLLAESVTNARVVMPPNGYKDFRDWVKGQGVAPVRSVLNSVIGGKPYGKA